jgi:hypothetical protein
VLVARRIVDVTMKDGWIPIRREVIPAFRELFQRQATVFGEAAARIQLELEGLDTQWTLIHPDGEA